MRHVSYSIVGMYMCGVLALLPGCAGYQSQPLPMLKIKRSKPVAEEPIALSWKTLSTKESQRYLGRDVLAVGYLPIQLTIDNQGSSSWRFSPKRISLPLVPSDVVAKAVATSTSGRALGWGIPGLFIWPLLIPAAVDASWSYEANEQLELDYSTKEVDDQLINPFEKYNGLVFINKEDFDADEPFTVTLVDDDTGEKLMLQSVGARV